MKRTINLFFVLLMMLFAKESFALACVLNDNPKDREKGTVEQTVSINSPMSVPPELPVGSVIWRSEQFSLDLVCWQDQSAPAQNVYVYLNPYDPAHDKLGPNIELGVNFNGQDLVCSKLPGCRLDTGVVLPYCGAYWGCGTNTGDVFVPLKVSFNFFIAKKTKGVSGPEWEDTTVVPGATPSFVYTSLQFDGVGGINTLPRARNFKLHLSGLHRLRYVGCPSTVDISPRSVDFGFVRAASAAQNVTILEKDVTITARKNCASPYGLAGNFIPISGDLADGDSTLVPANNKSVGIQLIDKKTNTPLQFKKEFELAPTQNTAQENRTDLLARLFWRQNTAILGTFNASAQLEVYYK